MIRRRNSLFLTEANMVPPYSQQPTDRIGLPPARINHTEANTMAHGRDDIGQGPLLPHHISGGGHSYAVQLAWIASRAAAEMPSCRFCRLVTHLATTELDRSPGASPQDLADIIAQFATFLYP
jgi:hypothetical protein